MKKSMREKFKARRENGTFFAIPTAVLDSPAFCGLTFKARALLLDLGAQFRGYNNGDLSASWSQMQARGWKSKQTLQRARAELLNAGLIEQTRQGGLHCPSLFAITWRGIDECGGKLDVMPNPVPSGRWRTMNGANARQDSPPHPD
jgi:hypothetical protein